MLRPCLTCGETVATARTFDNMILILDAGPVFGGLLVLLHGTDISDEPVAVFGEPVDDRPRYVGHRWHSKSEMGIV